MSRIRVLVGTRKGAFVLSAVLSTIVKAIGYRWGLPA